MSEFLSLRQDLEEVRKYIRDNDGRLSELEKKLGGMSNGCSLAQHNTVELNKLENRLQYYSNDTMKQEIAELRENIGVYNVKNNFQMIYEQLTELKEQMKFDFGLNNKSFVVWGDEMKLLKEVLRELIKSCVIRDVEKTRLLEKLDVGSARQTEKMGRCGDCEYKLDSFVCNSCNQNNSHWKWGDGLKEVSDKSMEDSGDEKSVMALSKAEEPSPTSAVRNEVATSTDSKEPEPIFYEEEIWKDEPRENDIKAMDRQLQVEIGTHIFVKREDLQWLLAVANTFSMGKKQAERYLRIKEEYKIE